MNTIDLIAEALEHAPQRRSRKALEQLASERLEDQILDWKIGPSFEYAMATCLRDLKRQVQP